MDPTEHPTRRVLRERRASALRAQFIRRRVTVGVIAVAAVLAVVVPVGLAAAGRATPTGADPAASAASVPGIAVATALPVPAQQGAPAEAPAEPAAEQPPAAPTDVCADPAVQAALADGTDADVIAAIGGGDAFRVAAAGGAASCLPLTEADRVWVVVNKQFGLDPIDYWPEPQARAENVQRTSGGHMRADVAEALSQLVAAARDEGAGEIGVNSGFRSYDMQRSNYRGYVGQLGQEQADLTSARPGHSEHQTGLAVDVVACDPGCGGLDAFGGTSQSDWVAAEAWRFGFIVRYPQGGTDTTGYEWEPWHLRYIGTDLAAAYNAGGYTTLEDFFGLDPAPGYPD